MAKWCVKFVNEPKPQYVIYQEDKKGYDVIVVSQENESDAMHIATTLSKCGATIQFALKETP